MHFRKLTSYVSLFFLPTLFALSVISGNAATMTYDEFVDDVTSGIGQHLVKQVRNNEAIKEISPNFYPEITSIYNVVTANIMGELNQEQRVSIIESLPDLAVESCYLVAARALLFSRLDSSKLFGSGTLFTTGKPEENWHESFISHVFKTPLTETIEIKIYQGFNYAVEEEADESILTATKFAAGYSPYVNKTATKRALKDLLNDWAEQKPPTANEMFKQAFAYWKSLDNAGTKIDPRDMVFYLIFGDGITHNPPYLGSDLGSSFGIVRMSNYPDFFWLNDYVSSYQALEQDAFKAKESYMSWFLNSLGQALGLY